MMTNLYFQPIFNIDKYQAQILYSSYTEGTGYSQFWHKLNGSFALRIQDDVDNPDFDRYSNPVSKLNPGMVPVYTGLYDISYDYDNERYYYEPNLALDQPTWINPNEAIVEINPSAKFNNKNSVTAWDVVNTYFSGFKGSEDFGSYRRIARVMNQSMDLFETIKPINNSHVLFSFENAGTFNMKALTVPVFDDTIISNHTEGEYIFESLNGTLLQNGASGPYRSYNVNYDSDGSMSLLELFKVHDYWKGPANVSRLMFDFNPNAIEPTDGLLKGYTSLIAPTVKILHDSEGEPMSEKLKEYKNSSNFHQVSIGITQTIWINMDHPLVGLGLDTPLAQYNEIYANWEPGKFLRNAIILSIKISI